MAKLLDKLNRPKTLTNSSTISSKYFPSADVTLSQHTAKLGSLGPIIGEYKWTNGANPGVGWVRITSGVAGYVRGGALKMDSTTPTSGAQNGNVKAHTHPMPHTHSTNLYSGISSSAYVGEQGTGYPNGPKDTISAGDAKSYPRKTIRLDTLFNKNFVSSSPSTSTTSTTGTASNDASGMYGALWIYTGILENGTTNPKIPANVDGGVIGI